MNNTLEEQIFRKTAIRPPYYALKNLQKVENKLHAVIPVEQPLGAEKKPISASEAARHLAILGACAISLVEDKEHCFYLALRGIQHRVSQNIKEDYKELYGTATAVFVERRKAKAKTELVTDKGVLIYTLEVDFLIVPEKVFSKRYNAFKTSNNPGEYSQHNPYKENFSLYDIAINGISLQASLGTIKPERCAGHFPEYPALPLATLSYYQTQAVSLLLKDITGFSDLQYRINHVSVEADNLAFAGEKVNIAVKMIKQFQQEYSFEGIVTTETGIQISKAQCDLVLI